MVNSKTIKGSLRDAFTSGYTLGRMEENNPIAALFKSKNPFGHDDFDS